MQIVRWRCSRSRNAPCLPISWKSAVESLGPHKRWRARGDLIAAREDDEAAMSWKRQYRRAGEEKWREKSERAWAQDRWRAQNGDARKETGRIDGEGREAVEEGDEGAIEGSGRMARRKVSIGGTKKGGKKRGKKREKRERREGGKKLKLPLESNRFLGQGCREWKSKSASLDGRVIVLVFSPLFSFVPRMKFHCIEFCPGVHISLADYRWYRYCDINLSIEPLWLYRMEISLKVIRFVMQNCSFCKKQKNDRYIDVCLCIYV